MLKRDRSTIAWRILNDVKYSMKQKHSVRSDMFDSVGHAVQHQYLWSQEKKSVLKGLRCDLLTDFHLSQQGIYDCLR